MSLTDECIEGLLMIYQFHSIDAYETDQYFFKLVDERSLDRFNQFFSTHLDFEMKFVYRKNSEVYLKIEHDNITNFFDIPFEKQKEYVVDLHLHVFHDNETKGYYPKATLAESFTFPVHLRP